MMNPFIVMPVEAGIHAGSEWTPAFAGVTKPVGGNA
ncbi:MAG: hypothetical protein QOG72_235 [Sphingomonadales bacterium]|jgi:hypothetical protein|nr:hypothetical protein [Sphingomonadales bacterium]